MSKPMRFSVSQAKTHSSCGRKGYFEKVMKLPLLFADSTTRGSILHEVKERYLEADEQGKDENGNVVDLYPEGWRVKTDYERDADGNDTDEIKQTKTITLVEAEWIKRSVQYSIDKGYLWRPPNRVVEYGFEEVLLPADGDLPEIILIGYIDLAYDITIGDHKSCKNLGWVLNDDEKSSKYLGNDVQMLTYCYYWAHKRLREGIPLPETMTLEHYQHPFQDEWKRGQKAKDGVGIPPKPVRVTVTWERILENLETLKATAANARKTRIEATCHEDMDENLDTCKSYGGCPFKFICSNQESVEMYTDRMNHKINPEKYLKDKQTEKEVKVMSAFDDILGKVADNDKANTAGAGNAEQTTEASNVTEDKKSPKADSGTKKQPADTKKATKPKAKPLEDCTISELNQKIAKLEATAEAMDMDMDDAIAKVQAVIDTKQAEADQKRADLEAETKKKEADAKAKKVAEKKIADDKAAAEAKASEEAAGTDRPDSSETVDASQEVSDAESSVGDSGTTNADDPDYVPDIKSTSERAPAGVILCINATPYGNYAKQIGLQQIYDEYEKKHANASDTHAAIVAEAGNIVTILKGYVIFSSSITPNVRALAAAIKEQPKVQTFIGILS